jgi:cell division protein FtsB
MAGRAQTAPSLRLRPAPRSRSRGGARSSRVRWDKLGRVILVLALFGVLVSYIHPALGFVSAWNDKRTAATELSQLRAEHASLQAKATSLDGRNAAEQAARRLGMVANGERAYVIQGLGGN